MNILTKKDIKNGAVVVLRNVKMRFIKRSVILLYSILEKTIKTLIGHGNEKKSE